MALTKEQLQVNAAEAVAEKRFGLPAGLLASVRQRETGGNLKYLLDPATYHYGLNSEGKRVAGHTGKTSTAFGLYGIVEPTAKDPGYGVEPLTDKTIEKQANFAGGYLGALIKKYGLEQAVGRYGEGPEYAKKVLAGLQQPTQVAAAPAIDPVTNNLGVLNRPDVMASLGQVMGGGRPLPTSNLTNTFGSRSYNAFLTDELKRLGERITGKPSPVPIAAVADQQPVTQAAVVEEKQPSILESLTALLDSFQNPTKFGNFNGVA